MIEPNTRYSDMDEFIEDFMTFDGFCHRRGLDTSESIALYHCFIANELKGASV